MGTAKTVENISDTARWVAVYRAAESARPDALFRDPFAAILAGEHGENIVGSIPGGNRMGWAIVVRTRVIDEVILKAVHEQGVDTVLNLAAGLDTRPYRLDLPHGLKWIEVDLPGIFSYKESKLAAERPKCELERVKLDLSQAGARRELFARVGRDSRKVFVLTEGILMYLTPMQVESLAADLHAQPSFRYWAQDYVSQPILKIMKLLFKPVLAKGNSEFQFFTPEGREFFTRRGWREIAFHSLVHDAGRLRRDLPLGFLVRAADKVSPIHLGRRSGGILVLERAGV